jgi:hypothetical protein
MDVPNEARIIQIVCQNNEKLSIENSCNDKFFLYAATGFITK